MFRYRNDHTYIFSCMEKWRKHSGNPITIIKRLLDNKFNEIET